MSKKFNIKPPIWPKEYTFAEFAKLNSHIINENQLVSLYNQYLNKYLTELGEKKIHFKQSKINQLLTELKESQLHEIININTPGGGSSWSNKYSLTFSGDVQSANSNETYVSTTFNPDTYNLRDGFTVSFWVRPDQLDDQPNSFNTGYAIGRRPSNQERWSFGTKQKSGGSDRGNTRVGQTTKDGWTHGMTIGNWYHWVTTYAGNGNGKDLKTYLNGELLNDTSATWDDGPTSGTGDTIFFGAENGMSGYNQGWHCALTDIAIFNEVKELSSLHNGLYKPSNQIGQSGLVGYWRMEEGNGTTVKDSSGNGNHGTLTTNDATDGVLHPVWSTDVPE